MSYNILQCIIIASTLLTSIICGGLLIKNHKEIDFYNYTNIEKSEICIMIYVESFYLLFVLYFILKMIWEGLVFCWTDDYDNKPKFNIFILIFILLAGVGNCYLLYYLGKDKIIINKQITIISSILVSNMFFVISTCIINKCYILYKKPSKKYDEL